MTTARTVATTDESVDRSGLTHRQRERDRSGRSSLSSKLQTHLRKKGQTEAQEVTNHGNGTPEDSTPDNDGRRRNGIRSREKPRP